MFFRKLSAICLCATHLGVWCSEYYHHTRHQQYNDTMNTLRFVSWSSYGVRNAQIVKIDVYQLKWSHVRNELLGQETLGRCRGVRRKPDFTLECYADKRTRRVADDEEVHPCVLYVLKRLPVPQHMRRWPQGYEPLQPNNRQRFHPYQRARQQHYQQQQQDFLYQKYCFKPEGQAKPCLSAFASEDEQIRFIVEAEAEAWRAQCMV